LSIPVLGCGSYSDLIHNLPFLPISDSPAYILRLGAGGGC
jgi:hypothetical protein